MPARGSNQKKGQLEQDAQSTVAILIDVTEVDPLTGVTEWQPGTAPTKPLIYQPNNVPYATARKKRTDGSVERKRIEYSAIPAMQAAGWTVSFQLKLRAPKVSTKSRPVGVKIATGAYHCWNMPLATYNALSAEQRTQLGIKDISAIDAKDRFFGAKGFVLTTALGAVPAGTYISMNQLKVTFMASDNLPVRTFASTGYFDEALV